MRRRPRDTNKQAISFRKPLAAKGGDLALVLSGGGSRAAYQIGALRALDPYLAPEKDSVSTIVGSSIGAVNGLVFGSALKTGFSNAVQEVTDLWLERTFRNTFSGTPSQAFVRAIRMAFLQYTAPGPNATQSAVFDPSPLMQRLDGVIQKYGGLEPENREPNLKSVAVMTTIEGVERKPLLFVSSHKRVEPESMVGASFEICYVSSLSAKHGFASAALPSVFPPVELDTEAGTVRLVDGGISQNIPVDPAVRLGANRVITIDVSGRDWWLDRYGEPHDTRPTWEVAAAAETFCLRPPESFVCRIQKPIGPLFKEAIEGSRSKFIRAVGPIWPVFTLLKNKLGEEVAYEVMSYVALDPDYIHGLIERGYNETSALLRNRSEIEFAPDGLADVKIEAASAS